VAKTGKETNAYADKFGLKFDGEYLHAFKVSDGQRLTTRKISGRIRIKNKNKNKTFRCSSNEGAAHCGGFRVYGLENITVKVHFSDWGCEVSCENYSACRVCAFTAI